MDNLHTLTLADGLPAQAGGRELRYRLVQLRETTVADERWALRQAERAVLVNGQWKLLASDADYRFALTARHIEAFDCDGQRLTQAVLGEGWLDVVGKLTPHDLGLVEQRVFLLTLAAEVRYGHMAQADFDRIANGGAAEEAGPPQPGGEGAGVRAAGAEPVDGPALLADYAGDAAHRAPALDGR